MRAFCIATATILTIAATYFAYAWSLTGNHSDKIWLHRCNSIEKLHEMKDDYLHFETDVCLRPDGGIDVTHDLDTTFHLDLESFFPFLGVHHNRRQWIDVKNLSEKNALAFKERLEDAMQVHGVSTDQLVIESPRHDLLKTFTDDGFFTSCYVTAPRPSHLTEEQIDSVVAHYGEIASGGTVRALSFPGHWYEILSEHYTHTPIELLTWEHHSSELWLMLRPEGRKMLSDPRLLGILVRDKGEHHR